MWTGVAFGGLGELYLLMFLSIPLAYFHFFVTSPHAPFFLPSRILNSLPPLFFVILSTAPVVLRTKLRIAMSSMRGDSHADWRSLSDRIIFRKVEGSQ
ncbi:hypothetical protein B0H17DRAFT_1097921 [Mycena rosella]|uniref:Uncharacterized protein n=1 Tax=Mycena rosella TaxID=1033263 RepID=A0AAD7G4Y8_MYCRO|nr:hypothetical protein B0H17DRAFT_1097921 [Mycena rosella]